MKLAAIASLALGLAGCTLPMLNFVDLDAVQSDDAVDDLATPDTAPPDADASADASADADAGPTFHVTALATGFAHACVIQSSTTHPLATRVVCWGDNGQLQTGHGSTGNATAPGVLAFPDGVVNVEAISLGGLHSCGLFSTATGDQTVYCWGADSVGQLGIGASPDAGPSRLMTPIATADNDASLVGNVHDAGNGFGFLAANDDTSCATFAGQVYCWGDNGGHKVTACPMGATLCISPPSVAVPHAIPTSLLAGPFSGLAVGGESVCVLHNPGALACWGSNAVGQLGLGTVEPGVVHGPTSVPGITSGNTNTFALGDVSACSVTSAQIECWGSNALGRTGVGVADGSTPSPTTVSMISSAVVPHGLASHAQHSCAIIDSGMTIKCWGQDGNSQLAAGYSPGCPTCADVPETATLVAGMVGPFDLISVGGAFSCTHSTADDAVWCWGHNGDAELGNNMASVVVPQRIALPR